MIDVSSNPGIDDCSPAEVFSPGEYLRDELDARGWTQELFAEIIDRQPAEVHRIIAAKTAITPDTARAISAALGTTAELWMNLESAYRLWKSQSNVATAVTIIAAKARIFGFGPVKEIIKRHWIEDTENLQLLEQQVCDFFNVANLDQEPQMKLAAKKSTGYGSHNRSQIAWCRRAVRLARGVQAARFDHLAFVREFPKLRDLACDIENVRLLPKLLADMGVRLMVIEPIAKTRIDGATIWVNESPIVILSMRFDRIDAFWHSVIHELIHVKNRDEDSLDEDMIGDATGARNVNRTAQEAAIDEEASGFLIRSADLQSFSDRNQRRYSQDSIIRFANAIKMHPGVIVGQLHHREIIHWSKHRKFLMQGQVRGIVTKAALTDGWGYCPDVF